MFRAKFVPKYLLVSLSSSISLQHSTNLQLNLLRNLVPFVDDYTIVWKLDVKVPEAAPYKNIHMVEWMPQKDILCAFCSWKYALLCSPVDNRTVAFVTHGGYNSLLESSQAGVPMVLVPLFGDQYGNVFRAQRLSMGIYVDRAALKANESDEHAIGDALWTILKNPM